MFLLPDAFRRTRSPPALAMRCDRGHVDRDDLPTSWRPFFPPCSASTARAAVHFKCGHCLVVVRADRLGDPLVLSGLGGGGPLGTIQSVKSTFSAMPMRHQSVPNLGTKSLTRGMPRSSFVPKLGTKLRS